MKNNKKSYLNLKNALISSLNAISNCSIREGESKQWKYIRAQ